jgi:para-nitrobenzyl esterase
MTEPIATTTSGQVRGLVRDGVHVFRSIPYAAPPVGSRRFRPPQPVEPWSDVRDATHFGPVAPQNPSMLETMMGAAEPVMDEADCLTLTVFTPALDGAKRPVLFWIHGGAFVIGTGSSPIYDGSRFAQHGDVVVVSINYRLGAFGFLHLDDIFGEEFAGSGNAGILDQVCALEWVRDNIAAFGGDPSRVMIFGQSGGGSKTSTLLATPAAKGLFHRAAVQSGSTLRLVDEADAATSADQFLKKLGIARNRIADIQRLPWEQLLEAQAGINPGFTPVMDGRYLPHHPFDPAAPPESRDVPLIVSTTLEDAALRLTNWDLSEAGLTALLNERYRGKASEILDLYRPVSAGKTPYLIQAQVFTDNATRSRAITQAERKAAQGGAGVWMYVWEWATPGFNGKLGAVHGHDVDASFNLYRNGICGAGTKEGRLMCMRLASTWVAFAKTGNPDNEHIPHWPTYDASTRATMTFDTNTRVVNDPRRAIREYWSQHPTRTEADD